MNKTENKLTLAAIGVFILILLFASLGWCGKPDDHKPNKPKPSVSAPKDQPKAPVITIKPSGK